MTRKMMRTGFALLAAAVLGVALAPRPSHAQARQSVWDGVYTDAQADRGKGQYAQHCAVCHGTALEGNGESPPLTGEFIPDWAGTTLADLYDKIETTMPLNAPGTLRPAIVADILAYLLKENNFPAGQKELDATPATLGAVSFDVTKPKPAARASRARVQ
jgi:S-disulfanyl-L-cysteine oxidoreductase SoxD